MKNKKIHHLSPKNGKGGARYQLQMLQIHYSLVSGAKVELQCNQVKSVNLSPSSVNSEPTKLGFNPLNALHNLY